MEAVDLSPSWSRENLAPRDWTCVEHAIGVDTVFLASIVRELSTALKVMTVNKAFINSPFPVATKIRVVFT